MKFGQYELLEQIAVGGMAEVFKGRVVAAEGFEKLVAIKRILPDLAEDDRFVKMLLTEARIHSALSHRNIVQIHDLGISENGEYFIVLEFVEGYDLRVIMEQLNGAGEIIPEALSLHIAAEIAQGLNFAHELRGQDGQPLGLIHRDVTPSNILISFAGEVKLSDFGLAKRRHDRSVVGSLKGNLAYMSPEQANQAQLDRRTDIFSLGAILFELLTGKRLREITNEVAGWNQVASGVLPSARQVRPDLPAAVEHLLDRALAADPAKRFPDAATFGAAIRDVLGDLSVAVGASDLAALLSVIQPPRRPRTLMTERSKVIRLGPEAQALKEAIAAPATPAPVVIAPARTVALKDPGPTPPARSVTPPLTPARKPTPAHTPARKPTPARTPARKPTPAHTPARLTPPSRNVEPRAAARPAPNADPSATPPPRAPLPPARARGYTPFKTGINQPAAGPGPAAATSPLRAPDPELTPLATPLPTPPPTPPPTSPAGPGVPAKQALPGRATPPGHQTPRAPMQMQGPAPTAARGRQSGPRPAVLPETPAYGVQRPPPRDFARGRMMAAQAGPGQGLAPAPGPGRSSPAMSQPVNHALPHRIHHETARVQIRPQRPWGTIFMVLVLLLAAAGVGVHFLVVPLDVLIAWGQPTGLSIATEPSGAKLSLDGVSLPATAPTSVTVWRDRGEHVLEATHPGYQVAREKIRYDRSVSLSFVLRLQPAPAAPPAAAAPEAGAPRPPASPNP
jgi:eukaryotic-like serine/threonine-protein kinase